MSFYETSTSAAVDLARLCPIEASTSSLRCRFFIDWRVALDFLQLFTGLNLRVGFVCGAVVASVMQGVDALAR